MNLMSDWNRMRRVYLCAFFFVCLFKFQINFLLLNMRPCCTQYSRIENANWRTKSTKPDLHDSRMGSWPRQLFNNNNNNKIIGKLDQTTFRAYNVFTLATCSTLFTLLSVNEPINEWKLKWVPLFWYSKIITIIAHMKRKKGPIEKKREKIDAKKRIWLTRERWR